MLARICTVVLLLALALLAAPSTRGHAQVVPAELTVVKAAGVLSPLPVGQGTTWLLTVSNAGPGTAQFGQGSTVLTDDLPNTGLTYGQPPQVTPIANANVANLTCAINGASTMICSATGGQVTISPGGSFSVRIFVASFDTVGMFTNPRAGGICRVDPANVIPELNDNNNDCGPSSITSVGVDLLANKTNNYAGTGTSWTWTIVVSQNGGGSGTIGTSNRIFIDNLPSQNISYGAPVVSNLTNIGGAGTITCSIAGSDLTCIAAGGLITFNPGSSFTVQVVATITAGGTFLNPRAGGVCTVDPDLQVLEVNETNNSCTNAVTAFLAPVATPTPQPGATATPTPIPTVVPVVMLPPVIPQIFQNPGAQGVILAGNRATATPLPSAALQAAPVMIPAITPPQTGNAGLR